MSAPPPSSDVVERLRPYDVTDEMLNAGQERLCQLRNVTSFDDELHAEIFVAMFNAMLRDATIERLSAERLQLREALVEARQFVEKYAARGKQDQHGKQLMLEQIDEALNNTAKDSRHD